MPTLVNRDLLVRLLREQFDAVAAIGAELDDDAWASPTCLPGWTVKDNVSHMLGTEAMLLGERSPDVDVSHLDHLRNDIAKSNELWVESMRHRSGAEVLARFHDVTERRLAALDAMTQADFDAPSWTPAGPDETYGRFMRIRHYDCFLHEHDIRAALGRPDRAEPEHVRSAVSEPAGALGYIVGRRAKLPAGTTARIHVTGAVDATWLVEVAERAFVVDRLDGEPTVDIELPVMRFLRLTGGRAGKPADAEAGSRAGKPADAEAGSRAGDVVLGGDIAMATRLVDNLAFTI
jgi:uncharacterized protein (TIGR03083 family)